MDGTISPSVPLPVQNNDNTTVNSNSNSNSPPRNHTNANIPMKINITPTKVNKQIKVQTIAKPAVGESFLTDREISARNAEKAAAATATATQNIVKYDDLLRSNGSNGNNSTKTTPVSIPVSMLFNNNGANGNSSGNKEKENVKSTKNNIDIKKRTSGDSTSNGDSKNNSHLSSLLLSPSDITGTVRKFKKI